MQTFSCIAALAATCLSTCVARSTTTTSSSISSATAIAGNYSGALRPQIHFSPPVGFMNDPNGLHRDAEGIWHLYYQYNPTQTVAGNQHWGHATSPDLYHWENQAIAISPSNSDEGIFSGSAIIDVNNTSGFFPNQTNGVVAIYTLNTPSEQTQEIAYSTDHGYTFTKYSGNPVISINSTQFRDPKVIWHVPTQSWVAVISYAQEYTIGIWTSPNLKEWTHASNFSHAGLLGLQYECPNLVAMPMEGSSEPVWLLAISINPGAPLGGSTTQYFPGEFNGTHFTPFDHAARLSDIAKDNYAGQFFYESDNNDGRRAPVFLAWASNWEYTNVVPTGEEGWRSAMTIPRKTYLKNFTRAEYTLVQEPYGLQAVYGDVLLNQTGGNSTFSVGYSDLESNAVALKINITGLPSAADAVGSLNFTFTASATNESLSGGIFLPADATLWLNRGKTTGFDNVFFSDKFSAAIPVNSDGVYSLEVIVDRSVMEVYVNGGQKSATMSFFPTSKLDTINVVGAGLNAGVEVNVMVRALASVWAAGEDSCGLVLGNTTSVAR